MEEKTLRNVAISCSIFGLIILFFASEGVELQKTGINEVSVEDLGKNVRVCGLIKSKFVSRNQNIFLRISDGTGDISVVLFSETAKNSEGHRIDAYKLEGGQEICVIGYIDEYDDELEVIGKKISVN